MIEIDFVKIDEQGKRFRVATLSVPDSLFENAAEPEPPTKFHTAYNWIKAGKSKKEIIESGIIPRVYELAKASFDELNAEPTASDLTEDEDVSY